MTLATGNAARKSKWRPWLITLVLFLLLVAAIYWLAHRGEKAATGPGGGSSVVPVVSIAQVALTDMPVHYAALGTVTAYNTVNVLPQVSGQLVEVRFTEGQEVHKGDVLAVIDQRSYRAALAEAQGTLAQNQAQLRNAETDLKRYRLLLSQDSISQQQLDTQEALVAQYQGTVRNNEAQVATAQINLDYTEVKAPVDGRVGLRKIDVGNLVNTGATDPLVVITQVQPITVTFSLPEYQLDPLRQQLRSGNAVPVQALDRNKDQLLAEGQLLTFDNQIDVATGTVQFKAQFANQGFELFPNQFVNVRLLAQTLPNVLVVPAAAIQRNAKGPFVYVLDKDDKVNVRQITLGETEDEVTVAETGVKAGDRVVTEGADNLRDGLRVKIVTDDAERDSGNDKPASEAPGAGGGAAQ